MENNELKILPTNTQHVFTDSDLQQARIFAELYNKTQHDFLGLILRLEAAEKCLQMADDYGFCDKTIEAHDNWLKACGKGSAT